MSSGEFEGADDVGMAEHKDVGRRGDSSAGYDFRFAKEMSNEVEGMDVKVEQGITLQIVASEIVEVVTDKRLLSQSLLKDVNGRGITFLQAAHDGR